MIKGDYMLIDELLDYSKENLKNQRVKDVRIGLSYTGVLLENGNMGISYTFRNEAIDCCEVVEDAGTLQEKPAFELAKLALEPRAIDAGVGVATINAAINQDIKESGDILNHLNLQDNDSIGMIGNFKPVVNNIDKNLEIKVFEKNPQEEEIYPDWAAEQLLPKQDVVIISGTTLVNKTIDHLIEISKNAREIVILGPTTTMAPEIFKKRGVTVLGGTIVKKPEKAFKIISQGGGTRTLHKASKKVNLLL